MVAGHAATHSSPSKKRPFLQRRHVSPVLVRKHERQFGSAHQHGALSRAPDWTTRRWHLSSRTQRPRCKKRSSLQLVQGPRGKKRPALQLLQLAAD